MLQSMYKFYINLVLSEGISVIFKCCMLEIIWFNRSSELQQHAEISLNFLVFTFPFSVFQDLGVILDLILSVKPPDLMSNVLV